MAYKADIEIAQENETKDIKEIAEKAGIDGKYLELYGNHKAKINFLTNFAKWSLLRFC